MAEQSTTSCSEPSTAAKAAPKGSRGRPRKQPAEQLDDLEVSVEGKDVVLQSTRCDYRGPDVLFSLSIPNRLLFDLYKRGCGSPRDYISLLNGKVTDHSVAIQSSCDRIADNLARRAGKLRTQVVSTTGRAREKLLGKHCLIPVCRGDTVASLPLLDEIENLHIELADMLQVMEDRKDEIVALKDRMAHILQDRAKMMNSGKVYEEVSKRQQRRKLSHFRDTAEATLWFAETFGLIPDQLTTHTAHSGEQIVVDFTTNHSPSRNSSPDTASTAHHPDEFCAMQTLYLLDRFGVSDEFYHELTQVSIASDCIQMLLNY